MLGRVGLVGLAVGLAVGTGCKGDAQPGPQNRPPPVAVGEDAASRARAAGSELDHLKQWSGEPIDMALEAAAGCDGGDAAACYRLGNLYEEGMGTPRDMARAHGLHARACDAGRGEACRTLGILLSYQSGPPADAARSLALLARACELDFLDACAMAGARILTAEGASRDVAEATRLLARGCQRGYWPACRALESNREAIEGGGVVFPSLATLPVDQLPVPSPQAACPPLHHMTTNTGGGARLNGGLAQVSHELLLAAIPKQLSGWTQKIRASSPAGTAGTRVSQARVQLIRKETTLEISIADNAMNCTLQPRTGEMAAHAPAPDGYEKETVDVAGHSAVAMRSEYGTTLTFWLADRCTVSLSTSPSIPGPDLVALAKHLDLAALDQACAARESGLGL